ncbi:hypothetical protein [Marisediminicola sp. LYQ134]|uniref:hypothetical protein n=1 Tax=Marisediminicola sp. LYQ134 TaxID=3391061 RepID=UPI0039832B81
MIVDLVLVAWAISTVAARDNAAGEPRTVAIDPLSPTPSATPTPEVSPDTASESSAPAAVAPTKLLAAVDLNTAWRATTSECPAAASPEVTTDGGATWVTTDATAATGITALRSIEASSAAVASMVGFAQSDCTPLAVRTFVGGNDYAVSDEQLSNAWIIDPADPSSIGSPAGTTAAPCPQVVDVEGRDASSVAALCADGSVLITSDAASTWSAAAVPPGTIEITASPDGWMLGIAGDPECLGVRTGLLGVDLEWTTLGCAPLDQRTDALPGTVAMSVADGVLWLWADSGLSRSSDGGVTWL